MRARPASLLLFLVLVLLAAGPTLAQEDGPADDAAAQQGLAPPTPTAAVVIDGVELFHVRGGPGHPAGQRAADIRERIVRVARDRSIAASTVRVEPSELGPRVTAGDGSVSILTALVADARLTGLTQAELAELYRRRVQSTIESFRELRSRDRLVRAAGWALGATAAFVLLWVVVAWGFRRLDRAIGQRLEAGVERLRIQSFRLLSPERSWQLLRNLLRMLRAVTLLVLLYVYLSSTLSLFPWTRGFALGMFGLVTDPLLTIGRTVLGSIPDLVFLAVLVVVTRFVLRLIHLFFQEVEHGAVTFEHFDADWAMPTYRLIRVLVVAFALVVAFPYIPGSNTGAFKGVSLFIGVLFSLGSSSVIGNVIAGYTMTYRRAFRDGDWIGVGDVFGEVKQTRLLVTSVRTPKNEDVVIPNSIILSNHVVNYSTHARRQGLILHTTVGIGYETSWRTVEAMLKEAARRTEGLLRDPAPFVHQTALGDFAVTYELNVYCDAPERMRLLYTALHRSILDVFNENGVQIMTPAYEGDPPEPKIVPPERWHAPLARPPDASR